MSKKLFFTFQNYQKVYWDGIYCGYGVATALRIVHWSTPSILGTRLRGWEGLLQRSDPYGARRRCRYVSRRPVESDMGEAASS